MTGKWESKGSTEHTKSCHGQPDSLTDYILAKPKKIMTKKNSIPNASHIV